MFIFISEGIFGKIKILVFEKGQILRYFSGLAPSKLKFFSKKIKGKLCVYRGYSFDTIFNMGYGGGALYPWVGKIGHGQ